MKTEDIQLTDHLEQFVSEKLKSGQYSDIGDVVRAGLRLLEAQEQERLLKLECLRKAAQAGFEELDRGEGITVAAAGIGAFLEECARDASGPAQL